VVPILCTPPKPNRGTLCRCYEEVRGNQIIPEGNLALGRVVEDIPAFCRELVAAVADN
jgi:hypothetical protein